MSPRTSCLGTIGKHSESIICKCSTIIISLMPIIFCAMYSNWTWSASILLALMCSVDCAVWYYPLYNILNCLFLCRTTTVTAGWSWNWSKTLFFPPQALSLLGVIWCLTWYSHTYVLQEMNASIKFNFTAHNNYKDNVTLFPGFPATASDGWWDGAWERDWFSWNISSLYHR